MARFHRADSNVFSITFLQTGSLFCAVNGVHFFFQKFRENIKNKKTTEED